MNTFRPVVISKGFSFKTIVYNDWTTSTCTMFSIRSSCNNMMYTDVMSGRDPFIEEIFYAISTILKKNNVPIDREYPGCTYRFIKKEGRSGCKDYYIETSWINGFPERRHILHISCNNKVNKIETDFRVFLLLMWSTGLVEDVNGYYKPVEEKVKLPYKVDITEFQLEDIDEEELIHNVDIKEVVQIRDIYKEEGWVSNGNKPLAPANYNNIVQVEE